jgi:hypothetical protein
MERFFLVYKTVNLQKGEYYIGVHITDDIDDGYLGSGKRLNYAINKHGKESFKREIIAVFDNPIDMFRLEAELVNEETLKDPLCINLKVGGHGGWKMRDPAALYTSEYQASRSKFGDAAWREKNAEKIAAWTRKGIQTAHEKLAAMRQDGYKSPGMLGKHHTDEFKQKISAVMSASQAGAGNSQYGTCWIHSLEEKRSIKVKKEESQLWVDKGWILGRKLRFD